MTEAEELELLELEEEEARLGQTAPAPSAEDKARASVPAFAGMEPGFKRDAAEKGYSALAGLTQGATFGGAAKYQAAQDTALGTAASLVKDPGQLLEPGKLIGNIKGAYGAIRDAKSAQFKGAEALNPKTFGVTEFAGGFIPTAGLPAGGVARFAAKGAVQGGANAFGHSEADSAGGVALDTLGGAAVGAVLDKAGGSIASRLKGGGFAKWLAGKSQKAEADQLAEREASRLKDIASKRGALGSEAADIIRSRQILADNAPALEGFAPDVAERMKAAANDPAALARLKAAAENYLPRITEGLEGFESKVADLAAAKARDPAAEAAEKLAHPIKNRMLPRVKTVVTRAGAPLVGSALGTWAGNELDAPGVGGVLGAGAGGTLSLVMGDPGRTMANMVKDPAVRKFAADAGRSAMSGLGSAVDASVLPAVREFTDDPEKFRAFSEWLRAQNAAQ